MLIRKSGEITWRAPAVTAYEDEAAIQALLAQSPELMPGSEGQRFAVATEVGVEAGYADIIAVTPNGDITLIECKLRKNPEIRRHVVGQILAYAATIWQLDYAAFDGVFTARAGQPLANAVAAVAEEPWNVEHFRAAVSDNLETGRFRLVIAVDDITDELRGVVRFLNSHTTADLKILALELRYVEDSGVQILFPTIYGEESASANPSSPKQAWDEERFFTAMNVAMNTIGIDATRRLYDFAIARGATMRWGGSSYPSVSANIVINGRQVGVFNLSQWDNAGAKIYMYFDSLVGKVSSESLAMLARDLREVPGMDKAMLGLEAAGYKKEPWILLKNLSFDAVEQLEVAFARLLTA